MSCAPSNMPFTRQVTWQNCVKDTSDVSCCSHTHTHTHTHIYSPTHTRTHAHTRVSMQFTYVDAFTVMLDNFPVEERAHTHTATHMFDTGTHTHTQRQSCLKTILRQWLPDDLFVFTFSPPLSVIFSSSWQKFERFAPDCLCTKHANFVYTFGFR